MRAFHFPNTEFGSYDFRRSVRVRRSVKARDELRQTALARLVLDLALAPGPTRL
jgi:hypothetical protein